MVLLNQKYKIMSNSKYIKLFIQNMVILSYNINEAIKIVTLSYFDDKNRIDHCVINKKCNSYNAANINLVQV